MSFEEALAILREEEERLERLLAAVRAARAALSMLVSGVPAGDGDGKPREAPTRTERVRFGKKTIAELLVAPSYVELRPRARLLLTEELKSYITAVEYELRQLSPNATVRIEAEDGVIKRALIAGLRGVDSIVKAKAALRNLAEHAREYAVVVARRSSRRPP